MEGHGLSSVADLKYSHHAQVLMVEDMAVVHQLSCEVLERHSDTNSLTGTHQGDIPPYRLCRGVRLNDLERVGMDVHGVVHHHRVHKLPVLDVAQSDAGIYRGTDRRSAR